MNPLVMITWVLTLILGAAAAGYELSGNGPMAFALGVHALMALVLATGTTAAARRGRL